MNFISEKDQGIERYYRKSIGVQKALNDRRGAAADSIESKVRIELLFSVQLET